MLLHSGGESFYFLHANPLFYTFLCHDWCTLVKLKLRQNNSLLLPAELYLQDNFSDIKKYVLQKDSNKESNIQYKFLSILSLQIKAIENIENFFQKFSYRNCLSRNKIYKSTAIVINVLYTKCLIA